MAAAGRLALLAALALFVAFFTNVSLGAAGREQLLGDLSELLVLGAAAVCFVIGVLQKEAQAQNNAADDSAGDA